MTFRNSSLYISAGFFAASFIVYCIIFDRQRRNDPNFKKKLKEKRCQRLIVENENSEKEMHKFFQSQLQYAENYLSMGDLQRGVHCLMNALKVCNNPMRLLFALEKTVPSNVIDALIAELRKEIQNEDDSAGELAKRLGFKI